MKFADMTIGLRVITTRGSVYFHLNVPLPTKTTGTVEWINVDDDSEASCVGVRLDVPVPHETGAFHELWIYNTEPDDRDFTSADDFEAI